MTRTATGFQDQTQELEYSNAAERLYCSPMVDGVTLSISGTPTWEVFPAGVTEDGTALSSGNATTEGARIYAPLNLSTTSTWSLRRYWGLFSVTQTTTSRVFKFRCYFDVVRVPLINRCPVGLDHIRGFHQEVDAMITNAAEPQASQAVDMYVLPAWRKTVSWVRAQGNRPGLISQPDVLLDVTRWQAIINFMRGNTRMRSDLRDQLVEEAKKELEEARSLVRLDYEPTDNADQTEVRAFNQPTILVGPDLKARNPYRSF